MLDVIIKWAVLSGVLMAAAQGMPNIKLKGWSAAFGSSAVFGIANVLLGWALTFVAKVLTFPFAILTFGVVWLLIPIAVNMVMLKIADHATGDDLSIKGIPALLGMSTAVTIASALCNVLL